MEDIGEFHFLDRVATDCGLEQDISYALCQLDLDSTGLVVPQPMTMRMLNELDWAGIEPVTIRFPGQTLYH